MLKLNLKQLICQIHTELRLGWKKEGVVKFSEVARFAVDFSLEDTGLSV